MVMTTAEIAKTRTTYDGFKVSFWTDGAVTVGASLQYVVGGSRGKRLPAALEANQKIADNVCLYNLSEIRNLVLSTRKSV